MCKNTLPSLSAPCIYKRNINIFFYQSSLMLGRQYRLSLILTPNWSALIYFGIRLKFLTVLLLFDVQFEGGRSTLLTV